MNIASIEQHPSFMVRTLFYTRSGIGELFQISHRVMKDTLFAVTHACTALSGNGRYDTEDLDRAEILVKDKCGRYYYTSMKLGNGQESAIFHYVQVDGNIDLSTGFEPPPVDELTDHVYCLSWVVEQLDEYIREKERLIKVAERITNPDYHDQLRKVQYQRDQQNAQARLDTLKKTFSAQYPDYEWVIKLVNPKSIGLVNLFPVSQVEFQKVSV